jgi:toxin ParE1/3/4
MRRYALSQAADADLQRIFTDSANQWGIDRAERYLLGLHEAFQNLAAFPDIGRDMGHLREGYFRFPHDRHSVFYRKTEEGIQIVRVLHQKQQPENYL